MMSDSLRLSRRSALKLIGASAAAVGLSTLASAADNESARLRALLDESEAADALLDPMRAIRRNPGAKVPAFVNPLDDRYWSQRQANRSAEWKQLQSIDRERLPTVDRIAYDYFAYQLRQDFALFEADLFEVQRKAPFNPYHGLQVTVPDFVSAGAAPFATVDDYELNLTRLDGFAAYFGTAVEQARRGIADGYRQPRVLIEHLLKQIDAMLAIPLEQSPFWSAINRMPASFSAGDRSRLTQAYRARISEKILPGYRLWQSFLRETYLPVASAEPGRWALKDGDRLYAWELARQTTTKRTPDEIHAVGVTEVARIRSEMDAVRAKVGFAGDLKAFFQYVRTDPKFYCKTPEELLGRFKTIEAKIWNGVPKLFRDKPTAPFEVRPLPALGDQRATGYYAPAPPDGVTPGILFFNMSMLSTRPIPTLETLTLHEGIPGHHFQTMLARENEALPSLLRYGAEEAFSEGWALYCESIGAELGMYGDPMQLFGHLDMQMLRAVRLVVDTGIHAQRWDRERAIDFMLDNTSMAPRDVAVEIDRYIAYPAQACAYKVGQMKIWELRNRSSRKLGSRMDLRDFHHQVIETGCLPMDVLEAKIDGWIASAARDA